MQCQWCECMHAYTCIARSQSCFGLSRAEQGRAAASHRCCQEGCVLSLHILACCPVVAPGRPSLICYCFIASACIEPAGKTVCWQTKSSSDPDLACGLPSPRVLLYSPSRRILSLWATSKIHDKLLDAVNVACSISLARLQACPYKDCQAGFITSWVSKIKKMGPYCASGVVELSIGAQAAA